MTLADLVDLEVQLARDRDEDPAALAERDRLLPRAAPGDPPARALRRWLAALRAGQPAELWPGRRVAAAAGLLAGSLAVAGLALGWAAATALLRFDGPHPVNVLDYLLAFAGAQVVLLAALALSLLPPVRRAALPLLGGARALLGPALARLAGAGLSPRRRAGWRALAHRLRTRRALYARLEPRLLLRLTQAFAVAFQVGVLAATLRLVAFTDVPFAWSTTLAAVDAEAFARFARAVAAPWAWLWPEAVPSPALVEATRYSRLEGAYLRAGPGRAADPALVGAWWPFLVAAVACYGLLPRLVTLGLAHAAARRVLARLPHDDAETAALARRLAAPAVETRAALPERPGPLLPEATQAALAAGAPAGRAALVLWRDVPGGPEVARAVAAAVGAPVGAVIAAGGREHEEGAIDWARAAADLDPVAVLAEAWEAPDAGALRLLRGLRAALGPGRRLVVLLAEVDGRGAHAPSGADVRLWRDGLARLEDPWLAVEPLEPAGPADHGAPPRPGAAGEAGAEAGT
jgi:hypothetical protein